MAASKKPKPGSAESKKAFYHKQRLDADKKGDLKTSTKIYDKLNKAQYGKSAPAAAKFRKNKSEYAANELTRPKDSKKAMKDSEQAVGKLEKARSAKSVAYSQPEVPTKAAKAKKSK